MAAPGETSNTSPLALLPLLLAACGGSPAPAPPGDRPPDVLLVVLDTVRADRLGCYGYDRPTSPTLDRLAREGVLCTDVSAQSSWTRPSMVSLMQSRYITDYRDVVIEGVPTLAELFRAAGYRTLAFVGNALLSHRGGFDRGWGHYDAKRRSIADPQMERPGRDLVELLDLAWVPLEEVLTHAPDRRPVLLYLHVMDPHDPYEAHPELEDVLPSEGATDRWTFSHQRARFRDLRGEDPRAEKVWRKMALSQAHYDQGIRTVDDQLGAFLADLDARGLAEDLLVAIAADHGEGLWQRADPRQLDAQRPDRLFFQTHGKYLHEELLRTPLILWGAGIPAGVEISTPVENVDLLPTLLELCDIPRPAGLHGRSLIEQFGAEPGRARAAVHAYVLDEASVREVETNLKLLVPREGAPRLYDLGLALSERRDLAQERPADVARLLKRHEQWRANHPLETTLGRTRDSQTEADMRAMGYLGDDDEER